MWKDWLLLISPGLSVITFIGGVFTARWLQNRTLRVRQRGVILSLLAEVKNIRGELGVDIEGRAAGNANDLIMWDGAHHRVPEVSAWISSLLPEIAALQPEVVGQFLSLRRHLANTASIVKIIHASKKSGRTTPNSTNWWRSTEPSLREHRSQSAQRSRCPSHSFLLTAMRSRPWMLSNSICAKRIKGSRDRGMTACHHGSEAESGEASAQQKRPPLLVAVRA